MICPRHWHCEVKKAGGGGGWRVASDRTLDTRFLLGIPLLESRNSTHGSALALQDIHRLAKRYWQKSWLTIHPKMSKLLLDCCFHFVQMLSNVAGWGTCCVGIFDSQNKRLLWLILIVTLTHCYLSSQFLFGTVEVYDKAMTFLAIRGEQRLAFPSSAKLCLVVLRLKALYRQDTKQAQLWLEDVSHLNHALVTFHEVLKFCHCFAIANPETALSLIVVNYDNMERRPGSRNVEVWGWWFLNMCVQSSFYFILQEKLPSMIAADDVTERQRTLSASSLKLLSCLMYLQSS